MKEIIKVTVVIINMIRKIRIAFTTTEKNNNDNGNNTATKKNHEHENIDNSEYQNSNNKQ